MPTLGPSYSHWKVGQLQDIGLLQALTKPLQYGVFSEVGRIFSAPAQDNLECRIVIVLRYNLQESVGKCQPPLLGEIVLRHLLTVSQQVPSRMELQGPLTNATFIYFLSFPIMPSILSPSCFLGLLPK